MTYKSLYPNSIIYKPLIRVQWSRSEFSSFPLGPSYFRNINLVQLFCSNFYIFKVSTFQMRNLFILLTHCSKIDEDINTNDTSTSPPTPAAATSPSFGPITHTCARKLNHQVSSFLSSCPLYLDNGNTHTFVVLRNDREDKKGRRFVWARFGQQDNTNL